MTYLLWQPDTAIIQNKKLKQSQKSFLRFLRSRQTIFIMPTTIGLVYHIILATMLAGSLHYNNNPCLLLTFLLIAISSVSVLTTLKNISSIRLISSRAEPVFSGKMAIFKLMIQPGQYQRYAISLSLADHQLTLDINPSTNAKLIMIPVRAKQRGILKPGPLTFSTNYPLGLFKAWTKIDFNGQCLIYPRPLAAPLNRTKKPSSADQPTKQIKSGSGSDDFNDLRPYRPGDPFQHISWKKFSRGHGLMTREFISYGTDSLSLDWSSIKGNDKEKKLSWLCAMVLTSHAQNTLYGLKLPGTTIKPNLGNSHKNKCLKALALF